MESPRLRPQDRGPATQWYAWDPTPCDHPFLAASNLRALRTFSEGFFALLVRTWQRTYDCIGKIRRPEIGPVSTPRELYLELAKMSIERLGGEHTVRRIVDSWGLDRRQLYRLRKCVRDLTEGGSSRTDSRLINELDEAIERAVQHALNVA